MKLSENLIARYRSLAVHCGDSFGIAPIDVKFGPLGFLWSDLINIHDKDDSLLESFPISVFLDSEYCYFCIRTCVYTCKRKIVSAFSFTEIAIFLFLVFCKHKTFDL